MSGFDAEREAIETRFKTLFGAMHPTVRVKYQNSLFKQPSGTPWVAISLLSLDSRQASIGTNPVDRYTGEIQVDILVPEDTGAAISSQIADSVSAIFKRQQFFTSTGDLISCDVPRVLTTGVEEGFHRKIVIIEYYRDGR